MAKQLRVPLSVTLREETLTKLVGNVRDVSPSDVISQKASRILEDLADGGLLLGPDHVAEVQRNFGKAINSASDVIRATEVKAGKIDGANAYTITFDPTWEVPLKLRAEEAGRTCEDLMNDMTEIAFASDWIFGLTPDYPPIYVPNYGFFQKLTGSERPTGQQVEDAIKELQKQARKGRKMVDEPEEVLA